MARLSNIIAATCFALIGSAALAQDFDDVPRAPVLRDKVQVTGDIVRIGDLIENAGDAAEIAVFRAPDLGTTGVVPVGQVLQALRAHQIIGVEARDLREVSVTRLARTLSSQDIEAQIAKALSGRYGLGTADAIAVRLDRTIGPLQLDATTRDLNAVATRYDSRNGRFDVVFEASGDTVAPLRLRFSGQAYETVETTVLTRAVDRGEVLKTADLAVERRPKLEAGTDIAIRNRALGMQMRKAVRAGQVLRNADFGKPDLVQRDQSVSIIYQAPGLYLTMLGKAAENGAEGDIISVANAGSKRVLQAKVIGPARVLVTPVGLAVSASTALDEAPSSTPSQSSE